ncbi:MAG: Asp23/Gls24 family envelope stress response protein [Opitutaceae bacterium]|jgi:uncharacterized alkaline shock family protein YloU|nr:Asp23/Gls24 family envelope stress response protein [Opitutaceae bacterium]
MADNEFTTSPFRDAGQPGLGDIKINHNVVAGIVRLAASQVPGVSGVGGGFADDFTELFAKRETDHRGVKIVEDSDDAYAIEVRIVITYGFEIGKTALDVQLAVHKQVMGMTGKTVSRVDVIVEGVRLPSDTAASDKNDALWPGADIAG